MTESDIPPADPLDPIEILRGRKAEGRRSALHLSSSEVLAGHPAEMLLSRLDTATIVIGLDGVVIYANPACERLLGYQTALTLEGQSVTTLMAGQAKTSPRACIELLRDPNIVTNWNHSDGYPIATVATDPMLLHAAGMMLMVSLRDVGGSVLRPVEKANRFLP